MNITNADIEILYRYINTLENLAGAPMTVQQNTEWTEAVRLDRSRIAFILSELKTGFGKERISERFAWGTHGYRAEWADGRQGAVRIYDEEDNVVVYVPFQLPTVAEVRSFLELTLRAEEKGRKLGRFQMARSINALLREGETSLEV